MKSPLLAHFLRHPYRAYITVFTLAIMLSAGAAFAEEPQALQQGDVTYISGGVGTDERQALEAVKKDYNLTITSADKTGHFRGDTQITIRDMQRNVLLDVTSQGPLFYAHLPNGRYRVEGASQDQHRTQTIHIVGMKPTRVHFNWPVSTADVVIREKTVVMEPTLISPDPITTP